MLSKQLRVSRVVFKKLRRPIKTYSSAHLTVRVFSSIKSEKSKFSVSVSKKIEKKAVLRNKMRRLAYDSIKDNLDFLARNYIIHFIFHTPLHTGSTTIKKLIPNEINYLLGKVANL